MIAPEDAEHLVLMGHLTKLVRVITGGQTQQQTIIILLHTEKIELGGVGEQCTIIVIHIAIDIVIDGIELSCTLQQFDL